MSIQCFKAFELPYYKAFDDAYSPDALWSRRLAQRYCALDRRSLSAPATESLMQEPIWKHTKHSSPMPCKAPPPMPPSTISKPAPTQKHMKVKFAVSGEPVPRKSWCQCSGGVLSQGSIEPLILSLDFMHTVGMVEQAITFFGTVDTPEALTNGIRFKLYSPEMHKLNDSVLALCAAQGVNELKVRTEADLQSV